MGPSLQKAALLSHRRRLLFPERVLLCTCIMIMNQMRVGTILSFDLEGHLIGNEGETMFS